MTLREGRLCHSCPLHLPNDTIDIRLYIKNTGADTLYQVQPTFAEDFTHLEEIMGKIGPFPNVGILKSGEKSMVTLSYTIRPEDVEAKAIQWGFVANGVTPGIRSLTSREWLPPYSAVWYWPIFLDAVLPLRLFCPGRYQAFFCDPAEIPRCNLF